jgi:hypothetical protein
MKQESLYRLLGGGSELFLLRLEFGQFRQALGLVLFLILGFGEISSLTSHASE